MGKIPLKGICDNEYISVARTLIRGAKREIQISTFRLQIYTKSRGGGSLGLYQEIIKAISRKIKVRVLTQYSSKPSLRPNSNELCMALLKHKGAAVRFLKRGRICHSKMLIVDGKKAIIGSHNLSVFSLTRNFEFSILTQDPQIIIEADSHFQKEWERAISFK
jgi:phosphatidylserine/phosphatidylglycerophosphate/cardiolipin synthase-like enzyme